MIFPACILRRETNITRYKDIKARVIKRMNLWEKGHISELV